MEAPATLESKPGSAARDAGDGQARNARSVTGPLAGAVLGPTVCGGCERGRWHRTTPTTGLFQRDGGGFGLGRGVFVTEEGLIEGADAGVDGVDPGAQRVDPAIQSTFNGVDASGQEGEQGDAGPTSLWSGNPSNLPPACWMESRINIRISLRNSLLGGLAIPPGMGAASLYMNSMSRRRGRVETGPRWA